MIKTGKEKQTLFLGGEKEDSRFLTLNPHRIHTVFFPADILMASLEIYTQVLCCIIGEQVEGSRTVPLGQGRAQLHDTSSRLYGGYPQVHLACALGTWGTSPKTVATTYCHFALKYPDSFFSQVHTYVPAIWIIWNISADVSRFSDSLSSFPDVQDVNTCPSHHLENDEKNYVTILIKFTHQPTILI